MIDESLYRLTNNATLTDKQTSRHRTNGTLILDYKTSIWEVKFFNLLSIKNDDVTTRANEYHFNSVNNPEQYQQDNSVADWKTYTRTHTLQEEFQVEDLTTTPPRYTYVHFGAVDDYLHQAASSDWWPEGIVYDPEDDGTAIASLGVHEHWNNAEEKKYSRNMDKDEGIELIYSFTGMDHTSVKEQRSDAEGFKAYLSLQNSMLNLEFNSGIQGEVTVRIFNMSGQLVQAEILESPGAHLPGQIALKKHDACLYVVSVQSDALRMSQSILIN